MEISRKFNIDNIRAILIFLVVLGHLIEIVNFPLKSFIYSEIYLFHMPAFVFVSGMCHKKLTGEKLLRRYFLPYLFFQIIYVWVENTVIHNSFPVQFAMPFWILWYLVALICWNVSAEALSFKNEKRMCLMLVLLIGIALIAGYDDSIGFYLSMSRTIVFFPFYYAGVIFKQIRNQQDVSKNVQGIIKPLSLLLILCCVVIVFIKKESINTIWLQSTASYANGDYNAGIRGIVFVGAAIWIIFLIEWVKDKEYPILTLIGQNTYLIFILHGFCIKALSLLQWNNYLKLPFLSCLVASVVIVFGIGYLSFILKRIKNIFERDCI